MAVMPRGRMGPPLRSFAADAHGCIMVRVLEPTGYKVVARLIRARRRAPLRSSSRPHQAVPPCSKPSRPSLRWPPNRRPALTAPVRDGQRKERVVAKKRAVRSNKETDDEKR